MPRFRALTTTAVAGMLLATAFIGPATAQQTITDVPLPLTGFAAITVHPTTGHVYVSSATDGAILAISPEGAITGHIAGIGYVRGIVVTSDTLYAALPRQDSIMAVDLTTFAPRATYSTGAGTCPTHLATTGEVIWFGYGCGSSWTGGGLGSMRFDPANPGTPIITLREQGAENILDPPLVGALRRPAGPIVIGAPTTSPTSVQVFDVVDGHAVPRVRSDHGTLGSDAAQVELTPDAEHVLVAAGSPYRYAQVASSTRLRWVGAYDTGERNPIAVVPSPDGSRVAAGIDDPEADNVFIYDRGQSTPRVKKKLDAYLTRRGLAWAPDGSRLYAVVGTYTPTSVTLRVLPMPYKGP